MGDVDDEVAPARGRLEGSLEALRGVGLDAVGVVGDADPVQAISDQLLKRDGEHVLLIVHAAEEDTAYAEQDLFENVKRDIEVPVTELRVTPPSGTDDGDQDQRVIQRETGRAFLINLGHVGALILMESVKYHGPFERFFARLSLYGTPLAIVISLLIA